MKNKNTSLKLLIFISFLINLSDSNGQKKWENDLKNPKEFIENKGQFDGKNDTSEKIHFGLNIEGTQIYFTSKGLSYRIDEVEAKEKDKNESSKSHSDKKMTAHEKEEEREKELRNRKIKTHLVEMNWVNSNPNVEIVKEQEVSNYYTFPNSKDKTGTSGIKAKAFKKIIYKNLYQNIDVEYFFPDEKEGFKYNIILHPGANPKDIQLKYSNSSNCRLDANGNITIDLFNKKIIEHSPFSFSTNKSVIKTNYILRNNIIGFEIEKYNSSETLIIDPWVTTTNFTQSNKGFDVDFDNFGNVFVFGGGDGNGGICHELKKYSNTGTLIWTAQVTTLNVPMMINTYSYSDFTVNHLTGESFVISEYNGAKIIKLDVNGIQISSFTPAIGNGPPGELLTIVYNHCENKIYVGCGLSASTYHILTLDQNLTNPSYSSVFTQSSQMNTDIGNITLDKNGANLYMINNASDIMCYYAKSSVTSISTPTFNLASNHFFNEGGSISYHLDGPSYNAIAVYKKNSFTYDSHKLYKYNPNGIIIGNIALDPASSYNFWDPVNWGGIDVDECENVYVGYQNTIRKYDSNLNLVSTITLTNTVYHLKLSDNNTLYACGNGFVTEIILDPIPPLILEYVNPTSCSSCDGSASISGFCSTGIDNYSFSWNTSPVQTNDTITNLCPGTYTVTVTKNGCIPVLYYTGTVTIEGGSGPEIITSLTSTIASCTANDGTALVNVTGGTPNFSFSWNTNPIQTTANALNLPAGMIEVTVTDASGCFKKDSILVTSQNTLDLTTSSLPISCLTNEGTATVSVTGGSPTYSYLWSNGDSNPSINTPINGNFIVTVTDADGCVSIDSIIVEPAIIPISNAGSNSPICDGETLNLSAINSSIDGISYSWAGPSNFTSSLQNPSITSSTLINAGVYTLTVSANDCTSSTSVSVVVNEIPISTSSVNTPICSGQTLYLTATSNQIATFHWTGPNNFNSNLQNPLILNATINETGLYSVTVIANECSSISSVNAIVNSTPTTIATSNSPICEGESLSLNATANVIQGSTYIWSGPLSYSSTVPNSVITPSLLTNSGVYRVITTANGCIDTSEVTVLINPIPVANFNSDILTGCEPLEVKFTDLSVPVSTTILWDFGDGSTSSSPGIVSHIFTSVGDYDISLLSTSSGCSSTIILPQLIHVSANANANFTADPFETTIFEPLINFTNHSTNSNTYIWNFGDNTNSNQFNPSHIYSNEPGNYNIQLIANNDDNCPDTTSILIKIIEPLIFYVPNTFTPDGNKFNETFIPVMTSGFDPKSYEMRVYNRWGEMVFETTDTLIGWDGKFKGEKVQDGTFTWEITFKDKVTDKKYSYNGHLNLLK